MSGVVVDLDAGPHESKTPGQISGSVTGSINISYTASCSLSLTETTSPSSISTTCFTVTEGASTETEVIDHDKKTITKITTIPVTVEIKDSAAQSAAINKATISATTGNASVAGSCGPTVNGTFIAEKTDNGAACTGLDIQITQGGSNGHSVNIGCTGDTTWKTGKDTENSCTFQGTMDCTVSCGNRGRMLNLLARDLNNSFSNYGINSQSSIEAVYDQAIDIIDSTNFSLTTLSEQQPDTQDKDEPKLSALNCTKWVKLENSTKPYFEYWCRIYKAKAVTYGGNGELDYKLFDKLTSNCAKLKKDAGVISQDSDSAVKSNSETKEVDESAWKEYAGETMIITLDPNSTQTAPDGGGQGSINPSTKQTRNGDGSTSTPDQTVVDPIRGLMAATIWRTILVPSQGATVTMKFKTPLKAGAVRKEQYAIRIPNSVCDDAMDCVDESPPPNAKSINVYDLRSTQPSAPIGDPITYGAKCGGEDKNPPPEDKPNTDGEEQQPEQEKKKCKLLTGCNKGGALYIKPWVVGAKKLVGDTIVFHGNADVCKLESTASPKEYVEKGEEQTATITIPADTFAFRAVIGCTFILNSFNQSEAIVGQKNVEKYVFNPQTEYVKMTIDVKPK